MKLSFTKAQMIQAIVILIAVLFVFSTVDIWFGSGRHNGAGGSTPSSGETLPTDEDTIMGIGNVALIIDGYSPILKVSRPNDAVRQYLQRLQVNGTVLYIDESSTQYTTVALARGDDLPAVASALYELDANMPMLLEAYVYSEKAFEFTTRAGEKISAPIPRSKINVARLYPKGEIVFFSALVQLYNGTVVGAKLTPLAVVESAELPVIPKALLPEHYVRLYFMWHDRNNVADSISAINDSLYAINATDVRFQYTSDITVYATGAMSKAQVDALRAQLPNLKVVQLNKIVFYDNTTYTEDEISDAVYIATNGTVNVSFSPPLLEIGFNYAGDEGVLTETINSIPYKPISKEIYRVANASTGGISVDIKGKKYAVQNIEVIALVPNTAKVGNPEFATFEVTILGDEIISARPILMNKYSAQQ